MYQIQRINEVKGFGLIATKNIQMGSAILEEDPLVCSQFSWNKYYQYKACHHCMKSLESAENMCRRLLQNDSFVLPHPECCSSSSFNTVFCPNCETEYCSSQCQDNAYNEYHQVLCPAAGLVDHTALQQLEEIWRNFHFPPETSSIMMIVRMIARAKQEGSNSEFKNAIEQFCCSCKSFTGDLAHKLLGNQFKEQLNILREQLQNCFFEKSVSQWYTPEGFQTLFALLGANQQGIGTSALSVWIENSDNLDLSQSEQDKLEAFINSLYEDLDRVAGVFLNCEGSGLYVVQSKCNHSCSPNAEICFVHNSNRLTLRALRNISKDEEITISYLSECELTRSRYSRQKHLRENYLFICECEQCRSQSDEPEQTSSEEEEDESDMELTCNT